MDNGQKLTSSSLDLGNFEFALEKWTTFDLYSGNGFAPIEKLTSSDFKFMMPNSSDLELRNRLIWLELGN